MEKRDIINNTLSIGAGVGTYYGSKYTYTKAVRAIFTKTAIKNLNKTQIQTLNDSAFKLYKDLKFGKQGIKIIDASKDGFQTFSKEAKLNLLKYYRKKLKSTKNPLRRLIIKQERKFNYNFTTTKHQQIKAGKNAFFNLNLNRIIINMQNGIHMFFHESGHAVDSFKHPALIKIWRKLTNPKVIKIPVLCALTAAMIFKPAKNNDNKELTPNKELTSFMKKYCGLISTIGYIPLLICEGSANIKGQKFAKKYVDKINRKILTKSHILSMASYTSIPFGIGMSVYFASKVKDKISEKLALSAK